MPTSSSAHRSVATASSTAKTRSKVPSSASTQQKSTPSKVSTRKTNSKNDEPSTRPPLATADIVEKATLSLNGLSTRDALTVWKALGLYLNDQLVVRRRVISIDRFGVFGYNDASEAVFLHSPVFLQSNRLKEGSLGNQGLRGQPALAANAAPMSKINATEIGNEYLQNCGREVVSNVVAHVVAFIGKMAKQGCALSLSLQPLGEWICTTESKAVFRFLPEFQKLMIQSATVKPQLSGSDETKKQESKTPDEMRERGMRDLRKAEDEGREPESLLTPKALEAHTTRENSAKSTPASSQRSSQNPSHKSGLKSSAASSGKRLAWSESDQQPSQSVEGLQKAKKKTGTRPSKHSAPSKKTRPVGVIGRVRSKLLERCGEKGLNALQRVLSLLDTSGDGALSAQELKFGLRDLGVELTAGELQQVVTYFDRNGDGIVSLDELLNRLRGDDLGERRRQLIEKAFDCMDRGRRGVVSLDDLKDNYDVSLLPRVRAGKKTKAQAMTEFLREWETSVEHNNGIPKEAFIEYYHNVSACIADDSDFELLMRQTWHVSPSDSEPESSEEEEEEEPEMDKATRPPRRREDQRPVTSSTAERDGNGDTDAKQWAYLSSVILPPRRGVHASITLDDVCRRLGVNRVWGDGNETMNTRAFTKALTSLDRQMSPKDAEPFIALITQHCRSTGSASNMISLAALFKALLDPPRSHHTSKTTTPTSTNGVIERIRQRLLQRLKAQDSEAATPSFLGLHALQRTLRLIDSNGDKRLSKDELKLGLRKLGVEINFHELDQLFTCLDADRSGCVDMDEFLVAMRGGDDALTSNKQRLALVHQAFALLDRDRDGFVTLDELSQAYDTSKHPEVLAGRMTPQDALRQFAQQWDTQEKDGIVTKQEFEAYYRNVSALVDRDDYFELMMRNAWHISGGTGQSANTSNRRVLVTHADGSQRVHEVQNDLGIRATDTKKIQDQLRAQGVEDAGAIALTGFVDSKQPAKRIHVKSTLAGRRSTHSNQEMVRRTVDHGHRPAESAHDNPRPAAPSDFLAFSGGQGSSTHGQSAFDVRQQRLRQREIRERAALRIQANFRGFKSRKLVDVVRRQQAAVAARRQREELEQAAPRKRVVARAALKSFYGF